MGMKDSWQLVEQLAVAGQEGNDVAANRWL
jgi:hypothetical protein